MLFCFPIFVIHFFLIFFFSSRRRHTRSDRDWSSDVCSSDLTERWRPLLGSLLPEHEIRYWPEIGEWNAIEYALVWQPEPGLLASLPRLKLIVGLGAGIDHLLRDPDLPKAVPIVRLVDPYMTDAMSEYVVLQVLRLHRQDLDYQAQQRAADWVERE